MRRAAASGIPIHEWLSIAFGAAIVIHLLLHWQWIVATIKRFFSKMNAQQRINFVLNTLLFIDVTIIIFTGLVISRVVLPGLGIETIRGGIWRPLHSLSSDIAVFIVGLHVAMHWQWIWSAIKRYFVSRCPAGLTGRAKTFRQKRCTHEDAGSHCYPPCRSIGRRRRNRGLVAIQPGGIGAG